MRNVFKKPRSLGLLLAAFTAVFVLGCVQTAVFSDTVQSMEHGAMAASDQHQEDHMQVSLSASSFFERSGIVVLISLAFLLLFRAVRDAAYADATQWRKRRYHQAFNFSHPITDLFRIGVMHPKIY